MLDAIRFQPEGDLLAELFERYGLEEILSHYETSGGPRSIHDYILGTHLRLTKVLSPRLWSLFDDVRSLIDAGAVVDAGDNGGWTPLHCAAVKGHAEAIKPRAVLALNETKRVLLPDLSRNVVSTIGTPN